VGDRATVMLVHGYAEHIGRYSHVFRLLREKGYGVVAHDHRGHGLSDGRRGHVERYETYLDDLDLITASLPAGLRIILGHSMGGLLALHYLLHRRPRFDAAIILAPYLGLRDQPRLKTTLGKLLCAVRSTFPIANGLDPHTLSRDPAVVTAYTEDPLVFTTTTPGWFFSMKRCIDATFSGPHRLEPPTLLLYGDDDGLCDHDRTVELTGLLEAPELTVEVVAGGRHELHNDLEAAATLRRVLRWLDEKVPLRGQSEE